jgi:hypothetical protein
VLTNTGRSVSCMPSARIRALARSMAPRLVPAVTGK